MTSHLAPISPRWYPRLKGASPADSLSGECEVQSRWFLFLFFLFFAKVNAKFFLIIRFSTEDVSSSTPERKPKPASIRHRNSADWLGLKTNDDHTFLEGDAKDTKASAESPKAPLSPSLERRPALAGSHATSAAKMAADTSAPTDKITKQTKPEVSKSQKRDEEEDDWLAGALNRKKALSVSNSEAKRSKQEDSLGLGEEVDLESIR